MESANTDEEATTIQFVVPNAGPHTITVKRHLALSEAGTTIDGFTQSGSAAPTATTDAVHQIVLDGSLLDGETVLYVPADATTIKGLRIVDDAEDDPAHVITLWESDDNVIAGCTLTGNVGGIGVIGGTDNRIGGPAAADRNVVEGTTGEQPSIFVASGGTGNLIQGNTVEDSGSAGIGVIDTPEATVQGNTVTGSAGVGIQVLLTDDHDASTISGNTVTGGTGMGIMAYAEVEQTENLLITGNTVNGVGDIGVMVLGARATIQGNLVEDALFGIIFMALAGADPAPDAPEDDAVGGGVIGGSGADANEVTGSELGGIALLDTTVTNAATLESDNTLDDNGDFEAAQLWRALVQVRDDSLEPVEGAEVEIRGSEMEEAFEEATSDEDGYAGPSGFDPDDVETWFEIPEWMVVVEESALVRMSFTPQEIHTTIDTEEFESSFTWNGAARYPVSGEVLRHQPAPALDPCPAPPPALVCNDVEVSDGTDPRELKTCGPQSAPAEPLPLVIGLHGGAPPDADGVGALLRSNGGCEMNELAARYGFLTAYPQGLGNAWNDCRLQGYDGKSSADDVLLVQNVVAQFPTGWVDTDRIYAWGVSNGGAMALRLATEFNDRSSNPYRLAATATVIANEPDPDELDGCGSAPSDLPSVLLMNGDLDDFFMPWIGGWVQTAPPHEDPPLLDAFNRGKVLPVLGTDGSVDTWLDFLGLGSAPATDFAFFDAVGGDGPSSGSSTVAQTLYEDPPLRLAFYEVSGGGHQVPGTRGICLVEPCERCTTTPQIGCRNADISAIAEIWRFFQPLVDLDRFDGNGSFEWDTEPASIPTAILDVDAVADLDGTGDGLLVHHDSQEAYDSAYLVAGGEGPWLFGGTTGEGARVRFMIDPNGATLGEPVKVLVGYNGSADENFLEVWLDHSSVEDYEIRVELSQATWCACGTPENFPPPALEPPVTLDAIPITDAPHTIEIVWKHRTVCARRIDSVGAGFAPPSEDCADDLLPDAFLPLDRLGFGMVAADPDDDFTIYLDALEVTRP